MLLLLYTRTKICYVYTIIVSRRRRVLYAYEYAPATCRVDAASLRAAFCDFIRCVLQNGVKCESMAERSFHIVFSICVVPGGEWLAETKRNETLLRLTQSGVTKVTSARAAPGRVCAETESVRTKGHEPSSSLRDLNPVL